MPKNNKDYTNTEKMEYLNNPDACPECKSLNIIGRQDFSMTSIHLNRTVECMECGEIWWDIYKLMDVMAKTIK